MRSLMKGVILFCLATSFALMCACSGGGSNGSNSNITLTPVSSSTGAAATVQVLSTNLALSGTTSVTAKFIDSSNQPVSGLTVTFNTTLGTLNPANGVATTDSTGTATVQLQAGTVSGAGLITASATVNGKQVVQSASFTVSLPTLTLSPVTLGLATISYGGSTSISVTVNDANGNPFTSQSVEVSFTSVQSVAGKATITSKVSTVNGVATATYQANTNTGVDIITASISGSSVTAVINVNPLNAQSISFVSASPTNIGLKGMGGLGITETSVVVFKVFDTSGQPKANQQVDFALNTTVGGLALTASSASSDSSGLVSTTVQAGVIATPVRVTATLRGITPQISTQSDQLVVSTGVPAQDSLSVAIATLNPECYNVDGVTDKVSVHLSDHFHNPVPDGTAVYFTTNGGSIQPSCTTVSGACSVTWTSSNPRPAVLGINNGRVTIFAYAVGEESFVDLNGNGVADAGEFTDDTEAFRDDNENGVKGANETFIDFNNNGLFDGPDGKYNGVLQGSAYIGAPRSKHIFLNQHLVMATSEANITLSTADGQIHVPNGGNNSFTVTVSDANGNTMPMGTTVSFSLTNFNQTATYTLTASPFTFPNSSANKGAVLPVRIDNPGVGGPPPTTFASSGLLKVTVTSPGGLITTGQFNVVTP